MNRDHENRQTSRCLFASGDLVVDRTVTLFPDLWLKVEVDQLPLSQCGTVVQTRPQTHLALVRCPVTIRVSIIDNLATSCIPYFYSGVRKRAISRPLEMVASRFGDQEGFGATLISIIIETFLYLKVHDTTGSDLVG